MMIPFPIEKLHTTPLGVVRVKRNLCLEVDDVVAWCKDVVQKEESEIVRKGKNYYVMYQDFVLTINAYSYTIITAHPRKL